MPIVNTLKIDNTDYVIQDKRYDGLTGFTYKGTVEDEEALEALENVEVGDTYYVEENGYMMTAYQGDNGIAWGQSSNEFQIDDDQTSTTKTWSSSKIDGELDLKLDATDAVQIDDNQISTVKAWSSSKIDKELNTKIENVEESLDNKLGITDYSAAAAVGTADNLIDRKAIGTTQNWSGMRTSCGSQSIDDDGYAQIRQITGIGVYGGVKATAIKTVGFNAYNHTAGTAALLGGHEYQITGAYTGLSYSTGEEITPDGDGLFTPTANGILTVTGGDATTTCVHLTWSGYRNGEFEEYWENTLALQIAQYFPNGMYATRHIVDTDTGYQYRTRIDKIESGKVTQWLKIQNIKDCTITKRTAKENQFEVKSGFTDQQIPGSNGVVTYIPCFLNSKGWSAIAYNTMDNANPNDKCISPRIRSNRGCIFEDSDYATYWQNNDIDGLKAAMGDVYVVYTLSSAIVTEIDPPLNLQYKVADFGTEEAVGGTFYGTVAYSSDFTRMVVNNSDHIGTLSDLQTTAKNNLVAAINEVAQGSVTDVKVNGESVVSDGVASIDLTDIENAVETNTSAITALDTAKANKSDLAHTNRVVSALVEAGKGKILRFETDDDDAYAKSVPSGALNATVTEWGGKSVVWNQILANGNFADDVGWVNESSAVTHSVANNILTFTTTSANFGMVKTGGAQMVAGHKYYISAKVKPSQSATGFVFKTYGVASNFGALIENTWNKLCAIVNQSTVTGSYIVNFYPSTAGTYDVKEIVIVDLTQLYGAGNEPTTTADPRIAAIEAYAAEHPEYYGGEIVSADVNSIITKKADTTTMQTINIPSAVLAQYPLRSAGSVYDTISFDGSKWWHSKRCAVDVCENLSWSKDTYGNFVATVANAKAGVNGVMPNIITPIAQTIIYNDRGTHTEKIISIVNASNVFYARNFTEATAEEFISAVTGKKIIYELATTVRTDITDLMGDAGTDLIAMAVESGGTITFAQNGTIFPVPNSVTYTVKISEVE